MAPTRTVFSFWAIKNGTSQGEAGRVNTLVKIATTLGVSIADLVEVVPDEDE
jgi:DNA-binding Xre family transcriptional regulator